MEKTHLIINDRPDLTGLVLIMVPRAALDFYLLMVDRPETSRATSVSH